MMGTATSPVSLPSHSPRDASELASIVRESAHGLRIRGAGTWLDAGHPVRASHELRLDAFAGVRAYVPADLTISVGAATTLAELDAVTAAHRQWCPLLPWGDDRATIGAVIATATPGPAADFLGRPRDQALGLECVDGLGRVVRAGGRVVKNVAGFDLTRLMTGSWGTLGVITEVHLRLRARPILDETWLVTAREETTSAMDAFLRGPFAPLTVHRSVSRPSWLVRIGGNPAFVAASREALRRVGDCAPAGVEEWARVRAEEAPSVVSAPFKWDALSRRVKTAFDPRHQLNPGLLGDSA